MGDMPQAQGGPERGRKSRRRRIAPSLDYAAMAGLALSLVVFTGFIPTLNPDRIMQFVLPTDEFTPDCDDGTHFVTVILSEDDAVYYYPRCGMENGKVQFQVTDHQGIGKVLRDHHKPWVNMIHSERHRLLTKNLPIDSLRLNLKKYITSINKRPEATFVLIKADDGARFGNIIDVIDECRVANITKYAIVDITQEELNVIASMEKEQPWQK
jgi:hypothetical protein